MQLSEAAYHFLGGLIKHAYTTLQRYQQPSTLINVWFLDEAPVYIAWGRSRSPLVRVPASRGMNSFGLRSVDPMANPLCLALAMRLKLAFTGLKIKSKHLLRSISMWWHRKNVGNWKYRSPFYPSQCLESLDRRREVVKLPWASTSTSFLETKRSNGQAMRPSYPNGEVGNYLDLY